MSSSGSQKPGKKRRAVPSENASAGSSPKKRHLSSGNMLISTKLTSSQLENGVAGPSNSRKISSSSAQSSVTPSRKSSRVSLPTPKRKATMPDQITTTENESDKTPPPSISQGLKRKPSDRKVEKSSSTILKTSHGQGDVLELSSDSDFTPKRPLKRAKLKHKAPLTQEVIDISDDEVTPRNATLKSSPAKKPLRSTQSRKVVTKSKQKKDKPISRPLPRDIIEIPSTDDEATGVPPKAPLPPPPKPVSTASKSNGRQSRLKTNSSSKTSPSTSALTSSLDSPVLQAILPERAVSTLPTKPPSSTPTPPAAVEESAYTALESPPAMDVDPISTDWMDNSQPLLQFTPLTDSGEPGSMLSPFELDEERDEPLSAPEARVDALATPRPESPAGDELLEAMSRTDSLATLPPLSPTPDPVIRHAPTPNSSAQAAEALPTTPEPIMVDLDSPSPEHFDEVDAAQAENGTGHQGLSHEQGEDLLRTPLVLSEPLMIDLDSPSPEPSEEMAVTGPMELTQEHVEEALRRALSRPRGISSPSSAWVSMPSPFRHVPSDSPIFLFRKYSSEELYAEDEEIVRPWVLWTDLVFGNAMKTLSEKREKAEKAEEEEEKRRSERKRKEKAKEAEIVSLDSPVPSESGDAIENDAEEDFGKETQDTQVESIVEALEYVVIAGEPSLDTSMMEDQLEPIVLGHGPKGEAEHIKASQSQQDLDSQMVPHIPREDARTLVLRVLELNALETYAQILGASRRTGRLPVSSPAESPSIFPSLMYVNHSAGDQAQASLVPPTSIGARLPIEDEAVLLAKSQHVALVFSQIAALQSALLTPVDSLPPTEQAPFQLEPAPESKSEINLEQPESMSISTPSETTANTIEALSQGQINAAGSSAADESLLEEAFVEAALNPDELNVPQSDILVGADAQVPSPRDVAMGDAERLGVQLADVVSATLSPGHESQIPSTPTTPFAVAEEHPQVGFPQHDKPISAPRAALCDSDDDVPMLELPVEPLEDPHTKIITPQPECPIPPIDLQSSEDFFEEQTSHPIAAAYNLIKNLVDQDIPVGVCNVTSISGSQEPVTDLGNPVPKVETEVQRSISEMIPAIVGPPSPHGSASCSTAPLSTAEESGNKSEDDIDVNMEANVRSATLGHDINARLSPSMLPPPQTYLPQPNPLRSPDLSVCYSSTSGSSDTTDDSVRLATPPPLESLPNGTHTKEFIYAFDVSVLEDPDLTLEKLRECGRNGYSQYDLSGDIDDYTFPDWS